MGLSLFRTGPDFQIASYGSREIPIFVETGGMRIFWPPTAWMVYLATIPATTRSPRTWRTYANGLIDWLRVCERNDWNWRTPEVTNIALYRNALLNEPSTYIERPLARATINSYITAICAFYRWANRNDHAHAADLLAYLDTGIDAATGDAPYRSRNPLLLPSDSEMVPRFFTAAEIAAIVQQLPPRDALIVEWALTTGARRHEIAALTLLHLRALRNTTERFGKLTITVTKGSRRRDIFVPRDLIDRTARFVATVRHMASPRARHRDELWLTPRGTALQPQSISAMFLNARKAAGMESGRFHDLRHTFAINMLDRLMSARWRDGQPVRDPLLALQRLLGHRWLSSTARYLRARQTFLDDLWDTDEAPPEEAYDAA